MRVGWVEAAGTEAPELSMTHDLEDLRTRQKFY